jgi:hypothetical protein
VGLTHLAKRLRADSFEGRVSPDPRSLASAVLPGCQPVLHRVESVAGCLPSQTLLGGHDIVLGHKLADDRVNVPRSGVMIALSGRSIAFLTIPRPTFPGRR